MKELGFYFGNKSEGNIKMPFHDLMVCIVLFLWMFLNLTLNTSLHMAERFIFEIRLKGLAFRECGLSLAGGHSDEKASLLLLFPPLLLRPVFKLLHIPMPMGDFSPRVQAPPSPPRPIPSEPLDGAWVSEYFRDLQVTSTTSRAKRCHPGHFGGVRFTWAGDSPRY